MLRPMESKGRPAPLWGKVRRAHLVLHRTATGDPPTSNNSVTYNTFYDVFNATNTFHGAAIWLAFPADEMATVTQNNTIENNAILLPPRLCAFTNQDIQAKTAQQIPLNTGIYISHPRQIIKFNKISGGYYALYYNTEGQGSDTATFPIGNWDSNTAYVGGNGGLVFDSRALGTPRPWRPTTQVFLKNFKAWGYDNNILSFDVNNVTWQDFKLFDAQISNIETNSALGVLASQNGTVTLLGSVLPSKGSVLRGNYSKASGIGTQFMINLSGNNLRAGGQIKLRGDVGGDLFIFQLGENGLTMKSVGTFDFNTSGSGIIGVTYGLHVLNFKDVMATGTEAHYCAYPRNEGACTLQGTTFKAIRNTSVICETFTNNAERISELCQF